MKYSYTRLISSCNRFRDNLDKSSSLDDKLKLLSSSCIPHLNSLTVSRRIDGQVIEDRQETRSLRSEKVAGLNSSGAMPRGAEIRLNKKTNVAVLYYQNKKYHPESSY